MVREAVLVLAVLPLVAAACGNEVDEGTAFMTMSDTGVESSGGSGDDSSEQDMQNDEGASNEGSGDGDGDGDGDGESSSSSSSTGGGDCGNGGIDQGEQCDGQNLNGFTCEQLGYGGGTLGCDPVTCTYDTSNCVPDMGGTSG